MNTIEKILANCTNVGSDDCWEWQRAKHNYGYGVTSFEGRQQYVHRIVYKTLVGTIPDEHVLHHRCENPACCNPEHLVPMTQGKHLHEGDTVVARNRAKTRCPQGHLLEGDNLYVVAPSKRLPNGGRYCRTCNRETALRYYHRKKNKDGS